MKDIGTLKAEKDAAGLIALSKDRKQSQKARTEAIAAIGEIIAPASYVIHISEKGDEFYQGITDNLAGEGYVHIINHLALLLREDLHSEVRREAAQVLGHVCSKKVVDPLVDSVEMDEEFIVQYSSVSALSN